MFLNWVAGDDRMVVNGIIFEHPAVNSLTQDDDIKDRENFICNETSCHGNKSCQCYHEVSIYVVSYGLLL